VQVPRHLDALQEVLKAFLEALEARLWCLDKPLLARLLAIDVAPIVVWLSGETR
jgi:hypothetical protein